MQTNVMKKTGIIKFSLSELFRNFLLAFLVTIVFGFVLGYKPLVVISPSMSPTIPSGSVIVIKKSNFNKVKEGDIVTFRDGQSTVTHRIIAMDEATGYPIQSSENVWQNNGQKGFGVVDVNTFKTESVNSVITPHNYQGTVVYYMPVVGTIMQSIAEPLNMMVLFIGIVLILFVINFM